MGLALTHFAVGALLMQLILQLFAPDHPYRHTLVVASGCWALLPDFHYISPILEGPLSELKFTVFGNLFWFHRFLDGLEPGRGSREMAALMLILLLVITVFGERLTASSRDS